MKEIGGRLKSWPIQIYYLIKNYQKVKNKNGAHGVQFPVGVMLAAVPNRYQQPAALDTVCQIGRSTQRGPSVLPRWTVTCPQLGSLFLSPAMR